MITTVTGKNQITLPAALVRKLDLRPGVQIEWSETPDGAILGRRKLTREELARKLAGRWRPLNRSGSDIIRELIEERVREDEEKRRRASRDPSAGYLRHGGLRLRRTGRRPGAGTPA